MVNLEKHYMNIMNRMDMIIDAAKCGKMVVAGDINKFGGRSWSRCYYVFINGYTNMKTGMSLGLNVREKSGALAAGAAWMVPFIHQYGGHWDLIGRPSYEDFKSWYFSVWVRLVNDEAFRKAERDFLDASGLRNAGYNTRSFAQTVDKTE